MTINKRTFVRLISFLTALCLVLGGFAWQNYCNSYYLKNQISLKYKQSLSEFASLLSEIDVDLKKQLYVDDKELLETLSTDISKNSSAAKECLERLPIDEHNAENIYKFLATTASFSNAIAKSDNDGISKQNKEQLKELITFSNKLNEKFNYVSELMLESDDFDADVEKLFNKQISDTVFDSNIEDIGEIAVDFPTLIYDGPFSDHLVNVESKLLENLAKVSEREALKTAITYTDEDDLVYSGDEKSNTESYIFEDDETVCAITKKGGYCLYFNTQTDDEEQKITVSTAIKNAKKYLQKNTGLSFKESYHIISEGVITINFAFYENGVTFYPDLIKVGVSLEDGEVVSYDARGFVLNHYEREAYEYKTDIEKAKSRVSGELSVKSVNKALIADDAKNEKYCYEVVCKTNYDKDIIVYINDETGKEENIFLIEHIAGGTLTR